MTDRPKVGDVVWSIEELNALPLGSEIVDCDGDLIEVNSAERGVTLPAMVRRVPQSSEPSRPEPGGVVTTEPPPYSIVTSADGQLIAARLADKWYVAGFQTSATWPAVYAVLNDGPRLVRYGKGD